MSCPNFNECDICKIFYRSCWVYKRFIEGFYKVACPITSLQRNNVKFIWSQRCEERFHLLKKLLTSTPIFRILDLEKDFVVCIDACI